MSPTIARLGLFVATLLCGALLACVGEGQSRDEPPSPTAAQAPTETPEPTTTAMPTEAVTPEPTAAATATATETVEPAPDETQAPERGNGPTRVTVGGERPAELLLPSGAGAAPLPLVVLLHGAGGNGEGMDGYFGFSELADALGFGLLLPTGTRAPGGETFWNGTTECCDIFLTGVDDVGYLKGIVEEARGYANFDKVVAVGFSNGGFMAYRLACEEVRGLVAIVVLAGGPYANAEECRAPGTLSVLHIHGDADPVILYEGGPIKELEGLSAPVPGAEASVLRWAERAGCDLAVVEELTPIDIDGWVAGAETTIRRYREGCAAGTVFELWTIVGGSHAPALWDTEFTGRALRWMADAYRGEVTIEADGAGG